jgi:hypothetical protein
MLGCELTRSGRQHGEEVDVLDTVPASSQLGAVVDDASGPGADVRSAADRVGHHQLADPERERHVGVERAVGVGRPIEEGRRVGGPNGYPAPGRLERAHDPQEAVHQRRVHDDQGVHVRRDGRVVREDGKRARSVAVLARARRRVVPEGQRERQQVSLGRALVIVHQQAAEASVEALVLAEDPVRRCRPERERDGQRDHERRALVQGDELIDALDDPVGEGIDEPGVLTDRLWEMTDLVEMIEAFEAGQKRAA